MWQCPACKREFKRTNQTHVCEMAGETVDSYIREQDVKIQPILAKIRATIHMAAPDAIEKISWRMPTFWQGQNLIHFAAFKNHIGLYPGELSRLPFQKRMAKYHTTKGAIQFPIDKPIDYDLIADITKYRVQVVTKDAKISSERARA